MLSINEISIKNFMSVGNVTQGVILNNTGLTLVLGNNLDLGGDGSRNGTGKTTLVNALSYGLFGIPLTNIKRDNLINKTNGKHMLVMVEFIHNNTTYRIERGRKPGILKFYVNNSEQIDETDEGQGESKLTQRQIDKILGMTHNMFKHVMALNTYTEPFLAMRQHDQRNLIEELLGITLLSEKAALLKELVRETKDAHKEEEFKIGGIKQANEQIESTIKDLQRRSDLRDKKHIENIEELKGKLLELSNIDIEQELQAHKDLKAYSDKQRKILQLDRDIAQIDTKISKLNQDLTSIKDDECYVCGKPLDDDLHKKLLKTKKEKLKNYTKEITEYKKEKDELGELDKQPNTHYDEISDAYNHKTTLDTLSNQLEDKLAETNQYVDQIETLKNKGLQEINWVRINDLDNLREHQEFLLKLLTNKDSFIRKKIIDQNLAYLNTRLKYYLQKLGLPHYVKFLSDMSVEITEHGRDLDFDNLSRGERNRLILGLSFSFRDIFESMNTPINLLFIDELIDSGMDTTGVESALAELKRITRERNKNVFLISHKDELVGRVDDILNVIKEDGFTSFSCDKEILEHT
jgi:DNA repair exonuclease SbcCD ATPase subunit